MREAMLVAGRQGALDHRAAPQSHIKRAGDGEDVFATQYRELAPQDVCAAQQGDLGRALAIGQANDPGQLMRRAYVMRRADADPIVEAL